MKDLEDDHLCVNCDRDKRDRYEDQFRRRENWLSAKNLLNDAEWPEDGKPCPEDVLRLTLYLEGDN